MPENPFAAVNPLPGRTARAAREGSGAREGSNGCLMVNLGSLAELTPVLRERLDRYHERLEAAMSAALTRAADRGEVDRRTHATRLSVMVGLAVAVNWMARAQGPEAARVLVTAARRQLSQWAAGGP